MKHIFHYLCTFSEEMKQLKITAIFLLLTSAIMVSCEEDDEPNDQGGSEQGLHCECDRIEQELDCNGWNTLATYPVNLYSPSGDCQELNDTTITSPPDGLCTTVVNGMIGIGPSGMERFIIDCSMTEVEVTPPDTTSNNSAPYEWTSTCHCRLEATYQIYNGFNWYDAGPTFAMDYSEWTSCNDEDFINQDTYVLYEYETVQEDVFRYELKYINYYLMNVDSINQAVAPPGFDC
jgi:hypothetical protein